MEFNRKLLNEEAKKKGWLPNIDMPCSPIIVHCLTGVGSSGALIAIEICLRKLDYSFQRVCGPCVDVRDTVLRLRTQREMTVQKPQQYLFIHLAVLEYAVRRRFFDSIENLDLANFLIENN
uniref:protein-tyrosine-phosphatase n=1 Tax=Panagrolaimus davidi TaxID=227884 RepID=A0A914QN87_9BILA